MSLRPPSPERTKDTFLGRESQIKPGWTDHAGHIESSTREVHYDVLRSEGCSAARAREISQVSADKQARLLDQIRGERGLTVGRVSVARVEIDGPGQAPDSLFGAFLRQIGGA